MKSCGKTLFIKGAGKLLEASTDYIHVGAETFNVNNVHNDDKKTVSIDCNISLIWISVKLSGQCIPVMIDTGATPNCIALRCVLGSPILKNLLRVPYAWKGIIDANGNLIHPKFVISPTLVLGLPTISFQSSFIVVETLPFSCILGQNTFSKFSRWTINNIDRLITINDTCKIQFQSEPPIGGDMVQLFTTNKIIIKPNQFAVVNTRAHGS